MLATVVALAAVIALALAYAVVSERLDDGSLARRQLDVWVFVGGLACLVAMLCGGGNVHQSQLELAARRPLAQPVPTVVVRQLAVSLGGVPTVQPSVVAAALVTDAEGHPIDRSAESAGAPGWSGQAAKPPFVSLLGERPAASAASGDQVPVQTEGQAVAADSVYTSSLAMSPPQPSAPALSPVVVVPPTSAPPPSPTELPPVPRQPTAVPSPWATPTPFCGDPHDIVLDLDVLDASIERDGSQISVRYRAQVHNKSTFPVRIRDLVVTLEGRDSGSERFGYQRLADMQVEPTVVQAIEGSLTLDKSPSPFGSTQLCVSLTTETCGQSLPYHPTKRCVVSRGF
jgi:hypothetical protein